MEHNETYYSLITNLPHWMFELTTTVVFEILLGLLVYPFYQRWVKHHREDDSKLEELDKRLKVLENE